MPNQMGFGPEILLSIVVPTFSRPKELERCLATIGTNLKNLPERQRLSLEVIVGDNCSPIPVDQIVRDAKLECHLICVRRFENIGMFANIMDLTARAAGKFVMWLTDDDWLLPGALAYLIATLESLPVDSDVGFLWGMLPTVDVRTGAIFTIASRSFDKTTYVPSGRLSAALHGWVGWGLTRQIYRKSAIDFEGVAKIDNAYFCLFLAARALANNGGLYLELPYVMHSYYNVEFWGEWGSDDLFRYLRIFCDALVVHDLALCPNLHENDIIEILQKRRRQDMDSYLGSDRFLKLVERDGEEAVVAEIGDLLGRYRYILGEVQDFLRSNRPRSDS